jgi:hypothetical protein
MVMMIIILSILSNTLFSLGYIMLLCCVMYLSKLFYDVNQARQILLPLLRKFVIPYMLFEILIQLLYQLPTINRYFKDDNRYEAIKQIPRVLGLEQYYVLNLGEDFLPEIQEKHDLKSLGQLWCKAFAYFFISLQIQII